MMRLQLNLILKLSVAATAMSVLAACAGGPSVKEDSQAAKRAQAYLQGLEVVSMNGRMDAKSCSVPSWADKPIVQKTEGPSKEWISLIGHANGCVKARDWKTLENVANVIARTDIDSPWGAYFLSVAALGNKDGMRAMWMIDLAQKKAGVRSGLFAYQKGLILLQAKETSQGMREMMTAVSLEPKLLDAQLFLAQIYHRDQEFDKADKHYQAALALDSRLHVALSGLAEVKIALGAGEEAVKLYERAISLQSNDGRAWSRIAFVYETMLKNPQMALSTYKSLKSSIDRGSVKDRPDYDLGAKIKNLEQSLQPRVPAQAATQPAQEKKVK